jgi:hypothetical protein
MSVVVQKFDSKAIVIDIEPFSIGSYRQMCAFITGQYGECDVGKRIAELESEEIRHLAWWAIANIRFAEAAS